MDQQRDYIPYPANHHVHPQNSPANAYSSTEQQAQAPFQQCFVPFLPPFVLSTNLPSQPPQLQPQRPTHPQPVLSQPNPRKRPRTLRRERRNDQRNEDNDEQELQEKDDEDGPDSDGADGEDQPIFRLPPPPECTYAGEAELEKEIHAWSLKHGYELVRRAGKKNTGGQLYKRYYHCSKYGKPANTGKLTEKTKVRVRRKSNRIGCPMSLAAVAVKPANPDGEWQVRLRKAHHNHGPLDAVNMTGHRRRARMGGVEKAVDNLFAIGTPTAQILQQLRLSDPYGLFTRADLANMKVKYKKLGTCVSDADSMRKYMHGFPSACLSCRTKKQWCDSARPVCGGCAASDAGCEYDHAPGTQTHPNAVNQVGSTSHNTLCDAHIEPVASKVSRLSPSAARQILKEFESSQPEHICPKRLSLQSSSVEALAQSSCGNGDTYRNVPMLTITSNWPAYHDAMCEAALKENTHDVLTGLKTAPPKPDEHCEIEEWNEYVKQLAIFNRRNATLLGAIRGTLAPSFRARVQRLASAREVWITLEEICLPRGSDQAFRLYVELHSITLAQCADLRDYIARLETAWGRVARLKTSPQLPHGRPGRQMTAGSSSVSPSSAVAALNPEMALDVGNAFPEEQLCFLFLMNLGPGFRRWVDGLCGSSNVGGFGTGPKLRFSDLTRRALEWDSMAARDGA